MSYDQKIKFNHPGNYVSLSGYNPSLGVPIFSAIQKGASQIPQLIPQFGLDYQNPDYNSLILGSNTDTYPSVMDGYPSVSADGGCGTYKPRMCGDAPIIPRPLPPIIPTPPPFRPLPPPPFKPIPPPYSK